MSVKEKQVFLDNFSKLCNTLTDIENLLKYFIQKEIIKSEDLNEISASMKTSDKVQNFLAKYISGPLEAGDNKGFYTMLDIMKNHGVQATKDLADSLETELSKDINKSPEIFQEILPTLEKSASSLNIEFYSLVTTVQGVLDKCSKNLETCKQFCLNLTISDVSEILLFDDMQLKKIKKCENFRELFKLLHWYWSWMEYWILKHIINKSESQEAKNRLEKYERMMGTCCELELKPGDFSPNKLLAGYTKMTVIIENTSKELTLQAFVKLRDFIFSQMNIKPCVAQPFIKFLNSLQLEWYVLEQAVPHMVKMSCTNIQILKEYSIVYMKIDEEIILDNSAIIKLTAYHSMKTMSSMSFERVVKSVTEVEYRGYQYSLVAIPPLTSQVVMEQTEEIERDLQLNELANDFICLSSFLRIAHCGVIGHLDLVIAVRRNLSNVANLCDDTVHAVNEFKRSSQSALDNMQTAYKYLQEDNKEEAIETFLEIKTIAQKMQKAASKLSERCSNQSISLMKVGEATQEKEEEVKKKNIEVNKNMEAQKVKSKIDEKSLAEEEAAAVQSASEIKNAKVDKNDLIRKREQYIEEEKQQLLDVSFQKQRITEQLQVELEQNLSQIREWSKDKLKENEKRYIESLVKNESTMNTILKANSETFQRQLQVIQDEWQKSKDTNKTDYETMLQSKYNEIENEIKLQEVNFSSERNDRYFQKLKAIEKDYSDKVASYQAEYEKIVKQNQERLQEQIDSLENEFIRQKEFRDKQIERKIAEINESYSQKIGKIDQKYINLETPETSIKETIDNLTNVCRDQIEKNENEHTKDTESIEQEYSTIEKKLQEKYEQTIAELEDKDKRDCEDLQTLTSTILPRPSSTPSYSVLKRIKNFVFGNETEVNARNRQIAEAEALEERKRQAIKDYEENKSIRNNSKSEALSTLQNDKASIRAEKQIKIKLAYDKMDDKNKRAIAELNSKLKAAEKQQQLHNEKLELLLHLDEEKSQAITSANSKYSEALETHKKQKTENENQVKKSLSKNSKDSENSKMQKCNEALLAKENDIITLKKVTIETKQTALRINAENTVRELKLQADKKAKNKWESAIKDTEEKKAKADAKAHKDKVSNDEKALTIKKQHDNEAIEKQDKDECKFKSEYEVKLKELAQKTCDDELKIKEYFNKKHENIQKELDELKQREEFYRKQYEEDMKQRRIIQMKLVEVARNISNCCTEVQINKLSIDHLQEAVFALRHIQDIMTKTAIFWKEVSSICDNVTGDYFTTRVSRMKIETDNHKKILTSQTFKQRALQYYGKWVAIKRVCTNAGKYIRIAQDDVHKYIRESPSAEEAKEMIRETAAKLTAKFHRYLPLEDEPAHES